MTVYPGIVKIAGSTLIHDFPKFKNRNFRFIPTTLFPTRPAFLIFAFFQSGCFWYRCIL